MNRSYSADTLLPEKVEKRSRFYKYKNMFKNFSSRNSSSSSSRDSSITVNKDYSVPKGGERDNRHCQRKKEEYYNTLRKLLHDQEDSPLSWGETLESFLNGFYDKFSKNDKHKSSIHKLNVGHSFSIICDKVTPAPVKGPNGVDYDKMQKIIRKLRNYIIKSSGENMSFFVNQFEPVAHKLNESEFNLLVYQFLTLEAQNILSERRIHPTYNDTSHFLTSMSRILSNEIPNLHKTIEEFDNYNHKDHQRTDIMRIYDDLNIFLTDISTDYWDEKEKKRRLFEKIRKYIPDYLLDNFESFLSIDYKKNVVYPSFEVLHNFLFSNKDKINRYIATKNKGRPITIHKTQEENNRNNKNQGGYKPNNSQGKDRTPCNHCGKNNHHSDSCYKHPDKMIRQANRDRNKEKEQCLLCRSQHKTHSCFLYPDTVPISENCKYCKKLYNANVFHPAEKCRNKCSFLEQMPMS